MRGMIVKWLARKRFGFIHPDGAATDIVLFLDDVVGIPFEGARVSFELDRSIHRPHQRARNAKVLA
jgi:cold shock CspA family protein